MSYQLSCSTDNTWYHDLRDSEGRVVIGKGATEYQAHCDAEKKLTEREYYIALNHLQKLQHAIDNDVIRSSTENDILKLAVKVLLQMNRQE